MARIEWVKTRLENWARWCAQQEVGALGYPRQATFARLSPPAGGSNSVPIMALDASEIDDAVQSLRYTQPHLHLVLLLTYVNGLPRHQVAKRMGKAESTVSANLEAADRAIARWLDDKRQAQAAAKKSLSP